MDTATNKLPIGQTFIDAYHFVFAQQFGGFAKEVVVPILLMLLSLVLFIVLLMGTDGSPESATGVFGIFILYLAILLILTSFISRWHKITLLGPERQPARIGFQFGAPERRIFWFFLLFTLFALILLLVPSGVLVYLLNEMGSLDENTGSGFTTIFLVSFIMLIVLLYLLSRLAFFLPATAMGWQTSLAKAWHQSHGNGIRLAFLLFLVELPWQILSSVADILSDEKGPIIMIFIYLPVTWFCALVTAALLATTISLSYKKIVGLPEGLSA